MSKRGAVASKDAGVTFEIEVASSKLIQDERGRLVEDPGLLGTVERFKSALAQFFGRRATFADTCGESGRYVITVTFDTGQSDLGGMAPARALEAALVKCKSVLDAHIKTKTLKTPAALRLQDKEVRLASLAAAAVAKGGSVSVRAPDADVTELVPPDLNAFSTLAPPAVKDKDVDGRVTGIGEDDGGSRIEVNRAAMYFVPGLSLDDAKKHFGDKAYVSARATWKSRSWQLKDAKFRSQVEISFPRQGG